VREVWEVPVWRGENGATGAAVVLPALARDGTGPTGSRTP